MPGFIYIWFDRHRKKFYVGCHWGEPNDGYVCSSVHMKRAYKNRPQDFKRRILVSNIITKSMMFEEELRYLNLASKRPERYYNKQFTNDHWSADEEKSKQVRKKISESNKGRSVWNKGKKLSEEHRRKLAEAKRGKPSPKKGKDKFGNSILRKSEEEILLQRKDNIKRARETLRKKQELYGNHWKGRKHSQETLNKMSRDRKGRKLSQETKDKMSEAHRGKPKTAEHRKRISEARMGKKRMPLSDDHRAKISASMRKHYQSVNRT